MFLLQALALADNVNFRNCLVTMCPATKRSELPTRSTVCARINNDFVDFLDSIKTAITNAPGSVSVGWATHI